VSPIGAPVTTGLVLGGSNNVFDVECTDTIVRRCSLKGKKLKDTAGNIGGFYNPLAPGDCVEIELDALDGAQGQITSLNPRKNAFIRWNVKGRVPQLLAANVDYVVLVTTPDEPPFRPRFIDRALIQADAANIMPLIVLNKCDLSISTQTQTRLDNWESLGYRVLKTSAKTWEGLAEFAALLAGKLSVFAGQSGVGKSSLINALRSCNDLAQRTAEISEKYGRGTHTTTKGVLLRIEFRSEIADNAGKTAAIIDTPGVRRFMLNDVAAEDVLLYFREMNPLAGKCAFGLSCTHTHERGCVVLDAVSRGAILADRYESWRRISAEIAEGRAGD
jgi:ribosome biogenesis GTPase